MEPEPVDEFLNRRQSVSFKIPESSSETDLTTLDAPSARDRRGSDETSQGPCSSNDDIFDSRATDQETADFSVSRRGSQCSTGEFSFPLSIGNFLNGISIVYVFVMSIIGLVIPICEALTGSWLETIYGAVFLTYQLALGFVFLLYLQFFHLRKGQSHQPVTSVGVGTNGNHNNSDSIRGGGASAVTRQQSIDGSLIWVDVASFGDVFTHPETSLFLRLGTLVFSLANLIYYGFEIATYMYLDDTCKNKYNFGWTYYIRFAFVLVQTYFLFKGPGIRVNKHVHVVWFGMLHLVSTNICLWFRIVVNEIKDESTFAKYPKPFDTKIDGVTNTTQYEALASNYSKSNCDDEMMHMLSRYLFPFILEYSLIAVGTIISVLPAMVAAKESHGRRIQDVRNNFRVVCLERQNATVDADGVHQLSLPEGQTNILDKSHRGFYIGALVVAGVVVAVLLFFLVPKKSSDPGLPSVIYHSTDICLHVFMLVNCVLAFVQMRPLGFVPKMVSTDDVLIVISMCGSVMYDVALIISSSDAISRTHPDDKVVALRLSSSVVAFVEVIAQTLFVLCSLRRYPTDIDQVERKPGRGAITTLVMANVAAWCLRTILGKGLDMKTQKRFFGEVAWLLLVNVNLPLNLFFRFHSSICCADVWHLAYAPLKRNSQLSRSSSELNVGDWRPASFSRTQNSPLPTIASIFAVSQSGPSSPVVSLGEASASRGPATISRSRSTTSLNSTLTRGHKKTISRLMNVI